MNEAHGMARLLADLLDEGDYGDQGAEYQIVVTDKAGNVAEVTYADTASWTWDEGCNTQLLRHRLGTAGSTPSENPHPDGGFYVQPGDKGDRTEGEES